MARRRIAHRAPERPEPRTGLVVALATVLAALTAPPIQHGLFERSESPPAPSNQTPAATAPSAPAAARSDDSSAQPERVTVVARPIEKTNRSSVRSRRVHRVTKRPPAPRPAVEVSFANIPDDGFRPDPFIRDIAALSRAYLWVSDGEIERARGLLERLADSGASERIRRRASELLIRASEPPPSSSRPAAQGPSFG